MQLLERQVTEVKVILNRVSEIIRKASDKWARPKNEQTLIVLLLYLHKQLRLNLKVCKYIFFD